MITQRALLLSAGYYGTLAATRALGRRGVGVTVADASRVSIGRWSRYADRRLTCPSENEPDRLVSWLLKFGRAHDRHVLYATSDDLCFLLAEHQDALKQHFSLYLPPPGAIWQLLDKRRLDRHAKKAGLSSPRTAIPSTGDEAAAHARELGYPVLIKPTTQMLSRRHLKGVCVADDAALRREFSRYEHEHYDAALLRRDPSLQHPMLQEFVPEASQNIYSISGFVDPQRNLYAVRACRKRLQWPRRIGVGIYFEDAPVDPVLSAGLYRLCEEVSYRGVFEAEFLDAPGGACLIDFNPRYFGQMGFDIARGLDAPWLVHLAATGTDAALAAEVARANEGPAAHAYRHGLAMKWILSAQSCSGAMPAEQARFWRGRLRESAVDAVLDADDRVPAMVERGLFVARALRNPRSFLRQIVLNR